MQDQIKKLLDAHRVPGCAIAARVSGEEVALYFGTTDLAGERAVDAETVFHLFSGTKLYTAAALMLLVERGLVSLDAEVGAYLPELALRHPITLRQLASHSSGLKDSLKAFMAVHFVGETAPSAAEALSRYATETGGAPGKKAAYRNVGYAILGAVISEVSGASYTDFVTRELLEPLGVEATFDYTDEMQQRAAEGTIGRWNPMRWLLRLMSPETGRRIERERHGGLVGLREFSVDTAAIGGLIGRAQDFLPLATEMLHAEDGLLTSESKETMVTLQARGQAGIVSAEGVGIGWKLGRRDGVTFWNHEGGGPGFTSETRIYPDDDAAMVVMMNATQSRKLSWLAHEISEVLREVR